MNKDDYLITLLLLFLFFIACFAPELYQSTYIIKGV
jgi:hypothetical protein